MTRPTVKDMRDRLESFASLKPGWCNGEGETFDRDQILRVASRLGALVGAGFLAPYVYPTIDGRIRAEWETRAWDTSVEIDPSDMSAWFFAINLYGHRDIEATGTLGVGSWLADALQEIGAATKENGS